jgi:hypothetical protein
VARQGVRRIERDLHDGAQARLVAMGMTLDAAGQLLDDNPAAARALLAEAGRAADRAGAAGRAAGPRGRGINPIFPAQTVSWSCLSR